MNAPTPTFNAAETVRFVPRAKTVSECEAEFRDACFERHETMNAFITADVVALREVAEILAEAFRKIAPLVNSMDMAVRGSDLNGFAVRAVQLRPEGIDGNAVIEAALWGLLVPEAEALAKAQLSAAVQS